jgi:Tfp pilus assembly protein PilO
MSSTTKLVFIVIAVIVGYFFIYSPMGDLTALMNKKQEYENSMATISNIESVQKGLQDKFNKISDDDKKNIDATLPTSFSFVKLVSQIDALSAGFGISIGNITLKGQSSSVGDSIKTSQPAKPYNSAIIGFSFKSSYENFNAFMNELGRSMRILDIKSMRLESGSVSKDAKDVKNTGVYSYVVEFETYWLNQTITG